MICLSVCVCCTPGMHVMYFTTPRWIVIPCNCLHCRFCKTSTLPMGFLPDSLLHIQYIPMSWHGYFWQIMQCKQGHGMMIPHRVLLSMQMIIMIASHTGGTHQHSSCNLSSNFQHDFLRAQSWFLLFTTKLPPDGMFSVRIHGI